MSESYDRLSGTKVSWGKIASTSKTTPDVHFGEKSQPGEGNLASFPDEGTGDDVERLVRDVASSRSLTKARRDIVDVMDIDKLIEQRDIFYRIGSQREAGRKGRDVEASEKGKQREGAREGREQAKRTHEPECKDSTDRKTKRPRLSKVSQASGFSSDDSDEEGSSNSIEFAWSARKDQPYESSRTYQNPKLAKKTNSVLKKYLRHEKDALLSLQGSFNSPPFPPSLWKSVLLNEYVSLNVLRAYRLEKVSDDRAYHPQRWTIQIHRQPD